MCRSVKGNVLESQIKSASVLDSITPGYYGMLIFLSIIQLKPSATLARIPVKDFNPGPHQDPQAAAT